MDLGLGVEFLNFVFPEILSRSGIKCPQIFPTVTISDT